MLHAGVVLGYNITHTTALDYDRINLTHLNATALSKMVSIPLHYLSLYDTYLCTFQLIRLLLITKPTEKMVQFLPKKLILSLENLTKKKIHLGMIYVLIHKCSYVCTHYCMEILMGENIKEFLYQNFHSITSKFSLYYAHLSMFSPSKLCAIQYVHNCITYIHTYV